MPDMSGSSSATDEWTTAGTHSEALGALKKAAEQSRWNVESSNGDGLDLGLGSRFAYRMLGFATPTRMVPIRCHVEIAPETSHRSRVVVHATTDEGFYLFTFSLALRRTIFGRAFGRLFEMLRAAVPPVASDETSG
jgi:hypothetical protein